MSDFQLTAASVNLAKTTNASGAMHVVCTSPVSPPTVPPRGKSKVVIMPAVCAVAGGSDALLALESLLWREHG